MPQHRDVVVVGASAGGVEALREFVAHLPAGLPASVLVVLHVPAHGPSALPAILARVAGMPVEPATDGRRLDPGRVYVAPPDHHLLVRDGRMALARGPMENGHRPAIDPLFRSAARALAGRVIGVVLSGALDDGSAGLLAVAARGGLPLVQDPRSAPYPSMPTNALAVVPQAIVGTPAELAAYAARHTREIVTVGSGFTPDSDLETTLVELDLAAVTSPEQPGPPAGLSCPDCAGGLFEIREGSLLRYRCRVGHSWGSLGLLAQQDAGLERALWMALRSLEEKVALCRRLAVSARGRGSALTAQRYDEAAADTQEATATLRALLLQRPGGPEPVEDAG
jgi:two-component system chemotaxis response regulator CheB